MLLISSVCAWAVLTAHAQLAVNISPPDVRGQKVVVSLAMKNGFGEKVESARAVVFLLDQDKMVGQASRWVIGGGKDKAGLPAGATNVFNFVLAADKPLTTNLTARVTFLRVLLESGKQADMSKDVQIQPATK
jgi:hypothetical protein